MQGNRLLAGFCVSVALAMTFSVFVPSIDICTSDWVRGSGFWSWYFGCSPDYPAVNEPVP